MKVLRQNINREQAIRFYVGYDQRKKGQNAPVDFADWPWDDPDGLDGKLREYRLKDGVLAAYKVWWFVELSLADLLDCAIVNHIPGLQPPALSPLVLRGLVETWRPPTKEWVEPLSRGVPFPAEWAMILRPSVASERPAKWYIEDGSGRALCLLQRILRNAEPWRVAYAYLGVVPDERSAFLRSHPELASATPGSSL